MTKKHKKSQYILLPPVVTTLRTLREDIYPSTYIFAVYPGLAYCGNKLSKLPFKDIE